MSPRALPKGVVARRLPISLLASIVSCEQEMPLELAQTIRTLRRDHSLRYEDIMWSLAESDPDRGQCFGFGKALTEMACLALNDNDPAWK
jgi:hypothetical protein